jgi:hypothetical protein
MVRTGEFRDAADEKLVADIMIKRRDKILKVYLPAVNPIVSARMDGQGLLTFDNAAVSADVAKRPDVYRAAWFEFDNATGDTRPLGETSSPTNLVEAPDGLPTANGSYVGVDISADGTAYEAWRRPVRVYFRREGAGWKLVGLERMLASASPVSRAAQ